MVGHVPLKDVILVRVQVSQPFLPSVVRAFGTDKFIVGGYRVSHDERMATRYNYLMYFTYILECSDKSLYVGCTNNLERRIDQHNNSKQGAHYTKIRRPVILKYKEIFETLNEARKRENEIKSWRKDKKLELISNNKEIKR